MRLSVIYLVCFGGCDGGAHERVGKRPWQQDDDVNQHEQQNYEYEVLVTSRLRREQNVMLND